MMTGRQLERGMRVRVLVSGKSSEAIEGTFDHIDLRYMYLTDKAHVRIICHGSGVYVYCLTLPGRGRDDTQRDRVQERRHGRAEPQALPPQRLNNMWRMKNAKSDE